MMPPVRASEFAPIATVAIVGAGFMGAQLALHIAVHGYPVAVVDQFADALTRMRRAHEEELDRRSATGALFAEERAAVLARVRTTTDLAVGVGDADLVIEAVPERLDLKRAVFAELDQVCPPRTILATNSSSFRVSQIEDAMGRPDRVLNTHFYPPVWQRPMVELMRGTATSDETVEWVWRFARSVGLTPLKVQKESTGFLFNRVWRAIKRETLHLVDEGVATVDDVDRAWMIAWGTPMGPFAVMDMTGLDVVLDVERTYYAESGDPRDAPPRLLTDKVAAGELGVKAGRGFYRYPHPAYQDPAWRQGEGDAVSADVPGGNRSMSENPLVGTWRLVSFAVRDEEGRIEFPFGRDAVGFITYTEDGQMAVQFGRAERARLAVGDWVGATPTEIETAAREYFAYCGTYEYRDGEVTHRVDLSLMPNWIGGELVRLVAFDGDRVTLSTPPTPVGGRQQIATLVWQRV